MNISVGIIGLPNVGKSTLFNALLKKQQALAANYPFATIEPNVGVVPVPDERLERLAQITKDEEKMSGFPPIKPATVQFLDIAGLVKGASEGAGLGNKFLSHIREVSIIAHVVRAFADENVIKEGSVDPKSDLETIEAELILADLSTLENVNVKKHESRIKNYAEVIQRLIDNLDKGIPAREVQLTDEEKEAVRDLFLLSAKPELVVINVSEEDYTEEKIPEIIKKYTELLNPVTASEAKQSQEIASSSSTPRNDIIAICAKIESELSELSTDEQKQYLLDLGLQQSGLERLIQKAYEKLGLISFLTAGEKEVRAWTIRAGSTALMASGTIHTDFVKKFIKAEVVSYQDFVQSKGWKGSREVGKARLEGRDYVIQDGDVVEFKIGA
ncbi:MAG: redox-regulated ATPase YchF [Candidatus Levybacteria bacterium]|nr:redox-regulated ATPase YchF [Candidatus Levybacteria bacterium]